MPRPRVDSAVPAWFELSRYEAAAAMDAADWYLNLRLRARAPDRTAALGHLLDYFQGDAPVLRRAAIDSERVGLQFDADLPSDCDAILRGREPQPGVYSLSVSALYVFERKFPEEVREFVRSAPYSAKHGWPAGPEVFGRAVDDVHGPDPAKQMMGRFARIDLSLPDKVLRADFDQYVAEQRAALAAIPGVHPYREALDELAARHALSLDSLVKHAVLPYIDIDRWRIGATATITAEGFADLLGIGQNALPKTREYAALLQRDFVLRGWLRPLASAAMRAPPTD